MLELRYKRLQSQLLAELNKPDPDVLLLAELRNNMHKIWAKLL